MFLFFLFLYFAVSVVCVSLDIFPVPDFGVSTPLHHSASEHVLAPHAALELKENIVVKL